MSKSGNNKQNPKKNNQAKSPKSTQPKTPKKVEDQNVKPVEGNDAKKVEVTVSKPVVSITDSKPEKTTDEKPVKDVEEKAATETTPKPEKVEETPVKDTETKPKASEPAFSIEPFVEKVRNLKQPTKYAIIGLCGLVLGGIGMYGMSSHIEGPNMSVVSVGNKAYTAGDILNSVGTSTRAPAITQYRSTLITNALASKYDSKDVNDQANQTIANMKQQYGGSKWKMYLASQGFSSEKQALDAVKTSLMLNKYVDSKVSESAIKKAYKTWVPNQEVAYAEFGSADSANKAKDKYNSADGNTSEKIDELNKDNDDKTQTTKLNSAQTNFDKSAFEQFANSKEGDAQVLQLQGSTGKKVYVLLILTKKAEKGSLKDESKQIKSTLRTQVTSQKSFGDDFIKDFKIKSDDNKFGDKLIQSVKDIQKQQASQNESTGTIQ